MLAELRKLSWAGVPADLRPVAWQLLLVGYSFSIHFAASLIVGISTLAHKLTRGYTWQKTRGIFVTG
jgi:hypothetical protein